MTDPVSSQRVRIHDLTFVEMISASQIQGRVAELGQQLESLLRRSPTSESPIFAAVLQGAAIFHADLLRAFPALAEVAYLRTRSYVGMASSGEVAIEFPDDLELRGRHLVLVEDIADSGRTLAVLAKACQARGVAALTTVVLLDKPEARVVPFVPDLVGFSIPPEFVVGYGLDYRGLGRNLGAIYQLDAAPDAVGTDSGSDPSEEDGI